MLRARFVALISGSFVALAVAGVVVAASGSGGRASPATAHGLVAASSSGARASTASATSVVRTFGPNVGQGIYQGVSPLVRSLPVLPVNKPSSITPRDNET